MNILVFIHQKETSLYSLSKSQDVVNLIGDSYFRNKLREVEAARHVEAVTRARGQYLPLHRGPGLQLVIDPMLHSSLKSNRQVQIDKDLGRVRRGAGLK